MTNLETHCFKCKHTRPYDFVVGPYGFFRPCSRKCVRPSYRTFVNGFAKKALAGPYGSYDKRDNDQELALNLLNCVELERKVSRSVESKEILTKETQYDS